MQKAALEDAELSENELQPEIKDTPTTEQPETPEPETTALVPTEPDVIDAEVIAIEPPEPFLQAVECCASKRTPGGRRILPRLPGGGPGGKTKRTGM